MSACAPSAVVIDPRALAKLLHPYRGLPRSHRVVIEYADADGKVTHRRTSRHALIAVTDGCRTAHVALHTLYDLLRLLPSPVALTLADDGLTLTWANGCAVLDPHTCAQATIPAVDVAPAQVVRK